MRRLLPLLFSLILAMVSPTELNTLVGLKGKGYVLLGGDTSFFRGMTVMEGGYKKVVQLDDHIAAAASGDQGDVDIFVDWLQRMICLRRLDSDCMGVYAAASLARRDIARSARERRKNVSMLLGGYDSSGAHLLWLDSLGTLQPIPFGAHGAASSFLLSMLDKLHRDDMSLSDAVALLRRCIKQLSTRFIVTPGGFQIMAIDKDGCREMSTEGDSICSPEAVS